MPKPPLSAAQESRLIRYLDQHLLRLSGGFERRHSGELDSASGALTSLAAFLDAVHPLLTFILCIPAAPPSHSLRIAYLLQLTGYLAPACDGYTLSDDFLPRLWESLELFDRAWVAVLRGQDWDSSTGAPAPSSPVSSVEVESSSEPQAAAAAKAGALLRTTDRVRLDSLVREIQGALARSLGLPEFVPLERDPFQHALQQRDEGYGGGGALERSGGGGEDDDMPPATPSLVSDGSTAEETDAEAMSIDTAVVLTPSEVVEGRSAEEDADKEEDEDGVDFEEVVLPSSLPALQATTTTATSSATSSSVELPSAYADPPEPDGTFQLHFTGIPPPTLQDGEYSLQGGQTPLVHQGRGFDPDEEYPLAEEEEGDPIVEESEGDDTRSEHEDGMDESTRDRLKGVFGGTTRLLEELKVLAEREAV